MSSVELVIGILITISLIFNGLGTIALHRFPDVYTRLHGATKTTTFGTIFALLAVILYAAYKAYSLPDLRGKYISMILHAIVTLVALIITNPTGAHAIARALYRAGYKPKYVVVDYYGESEKSSNSNDNKEGSQ